MLKRSYIRLLKNIENLKIDILNAKFRMN